MISNYSKEVTYIPMRLLDVKYTDGPIYSEHYFGGSTDYWSIALAEFVGRPVQALEVGAYEGKSTAWLLQHILTHPQASITVVDTWLGSDEHDPLQSSCLLETFLHNTQAYRGRGKVQALQGDSKVVLRRLPVEHTYHIIYIDGEHTARGVFNDAMLAFPLLHVGGILIFDDFLWDAPPVLQGGRRSTHWDSPLAGVVAFANLHGACLRVELLYYQVVFRKTCANTVFGTDGDYPPSVFTRGLEMRRKVAAAADSQAAVLALLGEIHAALRCSGK